MDQVLAYCSNFMLDQAMFVFLHKAGINNFVVLSDQIYKNVVVGFVCFTSDLCSLGICS